MIVLVAYSKKPMSEKASASADGHPQAVADQRMSQSQLAQERGSNSANGI